MIKIAFCVKMVSYVYNKYIKLYFDFSCIYETMLINWINSDDCYMVAT